MMTMKHAAAFALLYAATATVAAQVTAPPNSPTTPTTPTTPSTPGASNSDAPRAQRGARNRAGAQGAQARPRVSGEITKIEKGVYTVKSPRGETTLVSIGTNAPVMKPGRVTGAVADLKVGVRISASGDQTAGSSFIARRVNILNPVAQGTIETIAAKAVTLRTADGKSATYTIDTTTRFMRNRQPAKWSDFKAGEVTMVEYSGKTAAAIRNVPAPRAGVRSNRANRQGRGNRGVRARRNAPGQTPARPNNQPSTGPAPAPADDDYNDYGQ